MDVNIGDRIEVHSNKVDTPPRRGTVKEVVAHDPAEIRVGWDDGNESTLFPHGGMVRVIERSRG